MSVARDSVCVLYGMDAYGYRCIIYADTGEYEAVSYADCRGKKVFVYGRERPVDGTFSSKI